MQYNHWAVPLVCMAAVVQWLVVLPPMTIYLNYSIDTFTFCIDNTCNTKFILMCYADCLLHVHVVHVHRFMSVCEYVCNFNSLLI